MKGPKHGKLAEPGRMPPGVVAAPTRLRRQIAGCLAIFLAVPFGGAAAARAQQAAPAQSRDGVSTPAQPPTSPAGADRPPANSTQPSVVGNGIAGAQSNDQNPQSNATQSTPEQPQQSGTPNPVGTAAAPYERTTGVAASRPAGAVIAPAKQKRKRSFLIRVGLILGGAAAIGTVIALSNASPSRP